MAVFSKNKPVTLDTPDVKVEIGNGEKLELGANRFQLVVVDDAGNESEPVYIEVILLDAAKPTAVIDVLDEKGNRLETRQVREGQAFSLSGARSSDVAPGKVVKYRFTWVDRG